jgi:hypothetical protein
MRKLGRILLRFVFWSYERGSLQYDIAVALILAFVLLTPRSQFHDRAQVEPPKDQAGVELLANDTASGVETYEVDARLLALPIPEPELEHLVHDAVRKSVRDLQGKPFRILSIVPVRSGAGAVVSYKVTIRP